MTARALLVAAVTLAALSCDGYGSGTYGTAPLVTGAVKLGFVTQPTAVNKGAVITPAVQVAVQNCPGIPQASGDPALRDGPPIPANPAQSPGPGWRWMPVGTSPGTDEGAWWNPRTNEYLHPHFRPSKHGPHWDYRDPDGKCWRIYPDGRWESKPC